MPDYQELALTGVGTNVKDHANIITDDTYTLGQFKDDQLQNHNHYNIVYTASGSIDIWNPYLVGRTESSISSISNPHTGTVLNARFGEVTRGKRKGVKYIIKVLY